MNFPPVDLITDPAFKKQVAEFEKFQSDLQAARTERMEAENGREEAIKKDRETAAAKLREGKRDPGDKALTAFHDKVKNCQRKVEVLDAAVRQAQADLVRHLGEVADDEQKIAEERAAGCRKKFGSAVEALQAAEDNWSTEKAYVVWLKTAAEKGVDRANFNPQKISGVGLTGQHGQSFQMSAVLAALKERAAPPPPPKPPREHKQNQWPEIGVPVAHH